jgi:uncharacterized membrane protein YfcA
MIRTILWISSEKLFNCFSFYNATSFFYFRRPVQHLGGGIVKAPLMLFMGTHPSVSAASSAVMILCTSFTATTSYIVIGLLLKDYATFFFVIGFISTYIGQAILSSMIRRSNRNSYIVFSIGLVVLMSAILMSIQSIETLTTNESNKKEFS